jgi:hypothetical protein
MEPVSLTLGAIAALLVAKAEDKVAERAVQDGAGVLRRLVGWLRDRFTGDKDEAGARALARVEDAPDSPARIRELADVLDQRAGTDAEFRAALEALVAEARSAGVNVGSITQTAQGDQNVQSAGLVGSDIRVTYGQSPPSPGR